MILSDVEIKEAIAKGDLEVCGYDGDLHIGSSSLDLHLDNKAMILDDEKFQDGEFMDFRYKEKTADKFTGYNGWEWLIIYPNEFYILSSKEKIKFSNDIVGFVQGRSSLARMGIQVHCAGFADAGFNGTITLEVTNLTKYPILIPKDTRIAQMVFARTGKPSEVPYGCNDKSKYQGQLGPTITSIHKDFNHED